MGALTDKAYTSTFGSLGFFVAGNGRRGMHRRGRQARYQKDALPYGNNRTIQQAGYDEEPLTVQIVVKAGDWTAWRNAVNSSATLTILGDDPETAYLAGLTAGEAYPDDADAITASALFEF